MSVLLPHLFQNCSRMRSLSRPQFQVNFFYWHIFNTFIILFYNFHNLFWSHPYSNDCHTMQSARLSFFILFKIVHITYGTNYTLQLISGSQYTSSYDAAMCQPINMNNLEGIPSLTGQEH